MLGMMNSPSDSVEFYATNRKLSDDLVQNDPDLAKFSEVKTKDVITYTDDGRKLINGKPMETLDAPSLWGSALLGGRIRSLTGPTDVEIKKIEKEKRRNSLKLNKTIAVVASLQKMTEETEIIGQEPTESSTPVVEIQPTTIVGSTSIPSPSQNPPK